MPHSSVRHFYFIFGRKILLNKKIHYLKIIASLKIPFPKKHTLAFIKILNDTQATINTKKCSGDVFTITTLSSTLKRGWCSTDKGIIYSTYDRPQAE